VSQRFRIIYVKSHRQQQVPPDGENTRPFHLRATLCIRPIRPWPWGATALALGRKICRRQTLAKRYVTLHNANCNNCFTLAIVVLCFLYIVYSVHACHVSVIEFKYQFTMLCLSLMFPNLFVTLNITLHCTCSCLITYRCDQ
jgi:hypothetical protein